MAHKSFSFDELLAIADKHSETIVKESQSGKLLFSTYGARLLGLYPKAGQTNTLWIAADLDTNMGSGQWMTGGERLWISPERDFYYENPRDFDGFHVPASIDPGDYSQTGELTFENRFPALHYGRNETYEGSTMTRSMEIIPDPYETGFPYAGVAIKDVVRLTAENQEICGWSLAQVYTCGPEAPGTVFFPIKTGASILSYFDTIPEDRAHVEDGYGRYKIDADNIFKMAVRPEDMVFENSCKAVYVSPYPSGNDYFCLVKRTNDMPQSQSECVDVARSDPDGPKGAIQAYNNGPGFSDEELPFGEIELQLSKGVSEGGATTSTANHELLSYAGTKEEMLAVAKKALQLDTPPLLY